MRLYPPGWLLTRKAVGDDYLGNHFVPAGTELYIPPFLIRRSPCLWDDRDRFDPDRFAREASDRRHALAMVAFRAGPRIASLSFLARIEMQMHFDDRRSSAGMQYSEDRPPALAAGMNLLSSHDIHMDLRIKSPEQQRPTGPLA